MTESKRILLVEDYEDLYFVYQQYLGTNHHYEFATSAPRAIALISAGRFDHILCDYHLAGKTNGREVYEWVAENRPDLLEHVFVFVCAALDKVDDLAGAKVIPKGDFRAMQLLVSPSEHSKM